MSGSLFNDLSLHGYEFHQIVDLSLHGFYDLAVVAVHILHHRAEAFESINMFFHQSYRSICYELCHCRMIKCRNIIYIMRDTRDMLL